MTKQIYRMFVFLSVGGLSVTQLSCDSGEVTIYGYATAARESLPPVLPRGEFTSCEAVTVGSYELTALPAGWELKLTKTTQPSGVDGVFAIRGRLLNQADDIKLTIGFTNNMEVLMAEHTQEAAAKSIFAAFRHQEIDMTADRFMQAYPDPYSLRKALAGLRSDASLPSTIDRRDTERQKLAILHHKTHMYGGVIPVELEGEGFHAFYATHTRDDDGYTSVAVDICSPGAAEVIRLQVTDRGNPGGPERMAVRRTGIALIMGLARILHEV